MGLVGAICGVLTGCWLNAIFLELLVREDPACGNLVTFSQFLFISVIGFFITSKCLTAKRHIPVREYVKLVLMFFLTNALNNVAFNFKISMPLHMIFRSGSLVTNMLMGIVILKNKYPFSKFLSVALITFGVILCTLESSHDAATNNEVDAETGISGLFWWCVGISILVLALLLSALLGIYQEKLFRKHGKHPFEAMFFTHLLGLPSFLLMYSDISDQVQKMFLSRMMTAPLVNIQVPAMVLYLFGNVASQYICIGSVYNLSTETSSFILNLVLTLRKFLSLIFSIIYFQNSFTLNHWTGTAFVFVGTLIFMDIPQQIAVKFITPKKKVS